MKYGIWKVASPERAQTDRLISSGISPLAAAVLVSRGYDTPEKARGFLSSGEGVPEDPMLLPDMAAASDRLRRAIEAGEMIAVYGDYDVDGITATCLMTDFIRSLGGRCLWYIPGRMEEGYGLNVPAIEMLAEKGVSLIITVDCGITAAEEACFCRQRGIDLIITDHHECKECLPEALAVVNPHRADSSYPFPDLAGVGVAFKLASAVLGDQQRVLRAYCDLVALGTVADVMPLRGENRIFVTDGIAAMRHTRRPGILALLSQCQVPPEAVNATIMGFTLAPRINAAGRMEQVELAVSLFLTEDPQEAAELAERLYRLNRRRQLVEAEIYDDASAMLEGVSNPGCIVLASERWHQGVVGIVSSRLAEEYNCPVVLICLSGELGKASSRSFGGFPLFSALKELEPLLESYGGHEMAAGFTIRKDRIPEFRERLLQQVRAYRPAEEQPQRVLEADFTVGIRSLTVGNVSALECLEPFGQDWARPVLCMEGLQLRRLTPIAGGRHLRMQLEKDRRYVEAIFFATTVCQAAITVGDTVDIAFSPQINEFRGTRSVQLSLLDIRQGRECRKRMEADRMIYQRYRQELLTSAEALGLIPGRREFAAVWRYLRDHSEEQELAEEFTVLSRKIARNAGMQLSFARVRVCLDVLEERGLLCMEFGPRAVKIRLTPGMDKVDLQSSAILLRLKSYESR